MLSLVSREKLYSPQMGILAVLMVLQNPNLDKECAQDGTLAPVDILERLTFLVLSCINRPNAAEVDVNPSSWLLKAHLREFLDVVYTHPGKELDFGGSI
jgi:hypothetical protein